MKRTFLIHSTLFLALVLTGKGFSSDSQTLTQPLKTISLNNVSDLLHDAHKHHRALKQAKDILKYKPHGQRADFLKAVISDVVRNIVRKKRRADLMVHYTLVRTLYTLNLMETSGPDYVKWQQKRSTLKTGCQFIGHLQGGYRCPLTNPFNPRKGKIWSERQRNFILLSHLENDRQKRYNAIVEIASAGIDHALKVYQKEVEALQMAAKAKKNFAPHYGQYGVKYAGEFFLANSDRFLNDKSRYEYLLSAFGWLGHDLSVDANLRLQGNLPALIVDIYKRYDEYCQPQGQSRRCKKQTLSIAEYKTRSNQLNVDFENTMKALNGIDLNQKYDPQNAPSEPLGAVTLYSGSDTCQAGMEANNMIASSLITSIKTNKGCFDIMDSTYAKVKEGFNGLLSGGTNLSTNPTVLAYQKENCTGLVTMAVDNRTRCEFTGLSDTEMRSIRLYGTCLKTVSFSDNVSRYLHCARIKPLAELKPFEKAVLIHRNTTGHSITQSVTRTTDCNSLPTKTWGNESAIQLVQRDQNGKLRLANVSTVSESNVGELCKEILKNNLLGQSIK